MGAKRFLIATAIGGVATLVLGTLIYAVLLAGFFEANMSPGLIKDPPLFGWLILGQLCFGAVLALAIGSWGGVSSTGEGFRKGALLGLILGAAYSLTGYGTSNMSNLSAAVVDIGVMGVILGIAGAAIGAFLSRSSGDAVRSAV